jgi:hypothetical protein
MAAYIKATAGIEALLEGMNAGSDSWKVALSNTTPAGMTTFTPGTTDLATANGYTAGGNVATVSSATQSGGVYKLVLADPAMWTATGAVGPFQYAILWNATTNQVIGGWDYASAVTLQNGDTFTVDLDQVNGVFQVS